MRRQGGLRPKNTVFLFVASLVGIATAWASADAGPVHAQNPDWPAALADDASGESIQETLRNPATWPDDPGYGYDLEGDGETCSAPGARCWTRSTGGQWNLWSWIPPQSAEQDEFREEEASLGAGTWTDAAWSMTTGDQRVVLAVLDSGIKWDERDLVNQYFINAAELQGVGTPDFCRPSGGPEANPLDADGDGFVTMRDWFHGLTEEESDNLETTLDEAGNRNGLAEPGDLITACSDGVDDDGNGYVDDISGWDFHHDDNDPQDDNRFGHGTGEANWSAAEANNGIGRAGFCPGCRILMVRVGDSFIVDAQDYAQSVLFSVDSGALVIQEALGSLNNTTYMRRAHEYAYRRGVLLVASAADENSRHHNMPGTSNHTLNVHATRYAGPNPQRAFSFQVFNNCTNYGGNLALSAPGTGCSSEATGVTAGIAGLVYAASMAEDRPGGPLDPPVTSEEMRQILISSADDIYVAESRPDAPDYDARHYPSLPGWDQRFGYGRINAFRAVKAVREGRIPPEVDIITPDWFRVLDPGTTSSIALTGRVDASRAPSFSYTVEWASGIEPSDDAWNILVPATSATEAVSGTLAELPLTELVVDNPGEIENRFTVTFRIRATAEYGGAIGDIRGEQRRVIAVRRANQPVAGFPVALGVRHDGDEYAAASGEGSIKMADVDDDGAVEIIYGDADGLLHVFRGDGSEVPGYPIQLGRLRGLDPEREPNYFSATAYGDGAADAAVRADDFGSSILATPAVGDLTGDGSLEIVVVTMEGDIHVITAATGVSLAGWPQRLPEVLSGDPLRMGPVSPDSVVEQGAFASPALADLDADESLEIVIAAFDGKVHVFEADGTVAVGFPVEIVAPLLWADPADARPSRIMTSPSIGDVNGDGLLDIIVGSNETGSDSNTGAVHVIHGDGNAHPGGAAHEGWPISIISRDLFPVVGVGVPGSISLADVNGDGVSDLGVAGTAARMQILPGVQPPRDPGEDPLVLTDIDSVSRGPLSNITDTFDFPLFNTFATSTMGDLDGDGNPEYVTGGAGLNLAVNLGGGWQNTPFSHQVGAWQTSGEGEALPGFPQRIEDYLFFLNPIIADVTGDGYPELIAGSGGYYLHAWDACGREAPGWPKFVGSWMVGSPAVGDVDGDGLLEVAAVTRMGYLFVFNTDGPADGAIGWSEFRHDGRNTGNYDAPLSIPGSPVVATSPIECPEPPAPPVMDAGVDGGVGSADDGGCGCVVSGSSQDTDWPAWLVLVAGVIGYRRNRARMRRS